jgi:hypothetical protein
MNAEGHVIMGAVKITHTERAATVGVIPPLRQSNEVLWHRI